MCFIFFQLTRYENAEYENSVVTTLIYGGSGVGEVLYVSYYGLPISMTSPTKKNSVQFHSLFFSLVP